MSDNAASRLQINAGSVHLGRSNPGACQQDHVYSRPTLKHRMGVKVLSHKSPPTFLFFFSGAEAHRFSPDERRLGANGHACFCRSEDGGIQGKMVNRGERQRHVSLLILYFSASPPPHPQALSQSLSLA